MIKKRLLMIKISIFISNTNNIVMKNTLINTAGLPVIPEIRFIQLNRSFQILLDFMTCMEMFGNGVSTQPRVKR